MKIVEEASFYVAGYSVRTNNADEAAGRGQIGKLWSTFAQRNRGAKIPNRLDHRLIVVYSDYASDEKGDYSYLLGARVSSIEGLPAGMMYRQVHAGRYALFTSREGPLRDVVPEEWARIWRTPPAELGGRRAFETDYEVYDERLANPEHAQVEIHVGVSAGE